MPRLSVLALPGPEAAASGNVAPTASFGVSATDLRADFLDLSTDSDGTVVGWLWDFGDGSGTSTLQNPSYTYASAGTRTVSLTVTDNGGLTGNTTRSVTVSDPVVPSGNGRQKKQFAALRW